MKEIKGKYGTAKAFAKTMDESTLNQISTLMNNKVSENAHVRIMPDSHAGAGCVIGTTMKITDKICPNLVGVDIGCGISVYELGKIDINLKELDQYIKIAIPCGYNIRKGNIFNNLKYVCHLSFLTCNKFINIDKASKSIGTLGGGNHFIEIDIDDMGNKYLLVHTGSRHLGLEVAKYHQNLAKKECNNNIKNKLIEKLKKEDRQKEIETEIHKLETVDTGLEYLQGQNMRNYLNDIQIVQHYAFINRITIIQKILNKLNMPFINSKYWGNTHNYIDTQDMILRKGAICAKKWGNVIIPINMRDGSIIAYGKGNKDWNYSAPHGAGRVMSRKQAKNNIKIEDFKESMKGIYSSCICKETLDESPFAYKSIDDIANCINDTVIISEVIKPIYNFKACDK